MKRRKKMKATKTTTGASVLIIIGLTTLFCYIKGMTDVGFLIFIAVITAIVAWLSLKVTEKSRWLIKAPVLIIALYLSITPTTAGYFLSDIWPGMRFFYWAITGIFLCFVWCLQRLIKDGRKETMEAKQRRLGKR
jgi:cytochrome bd-type quinol oxidase subunit 1